MLFNELKREKILGNIFIFYDSKKILEKTRGKFSWYLPSMYRPELVSNSRVPTQRNPSIRPIRQGYTCNVRKAYVKIPKTIRKTQKL